MGTITRSFANLITASGPSGLPAGLAVNTPAFSATMTADQTFTDVVYQKVQYNSEIFDTDGAYDTTTYRFTVPSGKDGKYFFNLQAYISAGNTTIYSYDLEFRKNNTAVAQHNLYNINDYGMGTIPNCNVLLDLIAGDYVEVFLIINTANGATTILEGNSGVRFSNFQGFKLI